MEGTHRRSAGGVGSLPHACRAAVRPCPWAPCPVVVTAARGKSSQRRPVRKAFSQVMGVVVGSPWKPEGAWRGAPSQVEEARRGQRGQPFRWRDLG